MNLRQAFERAGIRLQLAPGDVITVKDAEVRFPRSMFRKAHEKRWAVVLSNELLCAKYDIVSIAPMTTNINIKSEADLDLKRTATNGLKADSRVELDHIMPIYRDWIIQKEGTLSDTEWEDLMKQVFWNFNRDTR